MEDQPSSSGLGGERVTGRGRGRRRRGETSHAQTELELLLRKANDTKRALTKMVKAEYQACIMAKQLERSLLPDAPPRKRPRNNSPERVPCRLVEGTPAVPPPPKPHNWQIPQPITSVKVEDAALPGPSTSLFSVPPPLMCDWTTGGLRQADPISHLVMPLVQCSSTSSIAESVPALEPPRPTSPVASCSRDEPEQQVLDWLERNSDAEEDSLTLEEPIADFTTDEPAYLPDDMNNDCVDFILTQDDQADRLLTDLLKRDRKDQTTFDWSHDKNSFLGQRENFVGPSGPTFSLETTDRPIDVFLKFFDNDVFDLIVSETNRTADYLSTLTFSQNSRLNRLKGTDKAEMGIFLAVLILQGVLPLPVEKDYFVENGYLTLKYFKKLMSYNRLILLKRLLHFTDENDASDDDKKLRKLGPLLNLLQSKFKELYLPSRDIAIDESLLKWHGRLSFTQKIATKAAKVGIKTYELCESSTGYCWNFFIYTGKGHTHDLQTETQGDEPEFPSNSTAKIVLDLVRPLLNRGHTLVMDNFYNSPLLARYLKQHGTDCFGTLRVNREFVPEAIKLTSRSMLRPGEMVQSYCHDLSVLLWRDNNAVAMISTVHAGEVGGRDKNGHYRYKPQVILDYNLAMRGVDKKDQLLAAHPMERLRNQVWYKKVFGRLLNISVLNAYIIFKTKHPRITQREFRTTLANEMIATFKPPQLERPLEDNVVRDIAIIENRKFQRPIITGNHFIGTGRSKYMKCVYCKNARTKYICKQCKVSLCLEICFESFHTVV